MHCVFYRTWSGPAWSPAQSLSSVLISIQSLMNEKPYHNEPGFEAVSIMLQPDLSTNILIQIIKYSDKTFLSHTSQISLKVIIPILPLCLFAFYKSG